MGTSLDRILEPVETSPLHVFIGEPADLGVHCEQSDLEITGTMEGIDWGTLGAVGETFGAIGVLASMIYFATMLRFNAAVTRDATTYSIMQLAINFRSESYQGELAEIRLKAATGVDLTALESLRFEGYLSALFEMHITERVTCYRSIWLPFLKCSKID